MSIASSFAGHPKIERAQQHLEAFNDACAAFVATKPYRIVDLGGANRRIELTEATPPLLGAILGDFVHNLRSALDHMVQRLVKGDGENRRRASFPILSHGNMWRSNPGCGDGGFEKIAGIPHEAIAAIEGLQPYNSVDANGHPLSILSRLDNQDKHRELNLVVAYITHLAGRTESGYWFGPTPPGQDDQALDINRTSPGMSLRPGLAIALGPEGPAANATLWVPSNLPPVLMQLLGWGRGPLLPEGLLASVVGAVRFLEKFLPRNPAETRSY